MTDCTCDATSDPPIQHRPWCGTEPDSAANLRAPALSPSVNGVGAASTTHEEAPPMIVNDALALRLARALEAWDSAAARTKAQAEAKARLEGMCDVLHAIGIGGTPSASFIAVAEAVRPLGAYPPSSAWNVDRKAWDAAAVPAVHAALASL